ncbi:general stress protein [Oryzibacter oryziterrae]|uniref:general stress protein n=1 Tax=Oryzibacter oryziterrae TaxID=2766474 RepID=UPI001F424599|nr:hypothetical protein [Oryzibacter oryziterrae]
MMKKNAVVAVFPGHQSAEVAIRDLAQAGFDMKSLSIVGKGYHSEEKATGFYNIGERVMFWGKQGAFWGGLWGLFVGGIFISMPLVGNVIVLGYLAATLVSMLEGAVVVGGLSALGAGLYSLGIPKDSIVLYEAAVKADSFLVMVYGDTSDMERAHSVLERTSPTSLHVHAGIETPAPGMAQAVPTAA